MRDIYNKYTIKGLAGDLEVYYPNSDEMKQTMSELILPNINEDLMLDISDYDGAKYLIEKFTNLGKLNDKAKKDLKKMLEVDNSPLEPVIQDLTSILQICLMEVEKMSEGVE